MNAHSPIALDEVAAQRVMVKPRGMTATMQNRTPIETEHVLPNFKLWSGLDIFPTPPWGTRSLFHYVLPALGLDMPRSAADPAAGLGHMSEIMREYVPEVYATDIYDYRRFGAKLDHLVSFVQEGEYPFDVDWIITNPPFGDSARFLYRAFEVAKVGVAVLVRLNWLESEGRYDEIWSRTVPTGYAWFTGRLPMCIGGYDPEGSTATAYAWFVWVKDSSGHFGFRPPLFAPSFPIPYEAERVLTRPEIDLEFAKLHVPGFIPPSTLKKQQKAKKANAEASLLISADAD